MREDSRSAARRGGRRWTGRWAMRAALALVVACAGQPRASEPSWPPARLPEWSASAPPSAKNSLGVVVEGGVSLGAYQAGYLYALSEELKREGVRPPLYVGASAGTINALLLGVEMCHPSIAEPSRSPFYQAWMAASLAALRRGATTSPSAVFPQDGVRAIADQFLRRRLKDGLFKGCDFVVAVETSLLRPRQVGLEGNDRIPDLQLPFTIRITADEQGSPRIHNYVSGGGPIPQAMLPLPVAQDRPADRDAAIDQLVDLVLASSAFPGAFPQVILPHCTTVAGEPATPARSEAGAGSATECGDRPISKKTRFLDGGILDNTPLGLAIGTALSGWNGDGAGHGSWGAPRPPRRDRLSDSMTFLFVNTDDDPYDPAPSPPQRDTTFLGFAADFAGHFVGAARGTALLDTLQRYPDLPRRLAVSQVHPRLASAYLADFFGFFDERLRDFDFTAGMYDAALFTAGGGLSALLAGDARPAREAPALGSLRGSSRAWRKLACMAQAYGPRLRDGAYDSCAPASSSPPPSPPWQALDALRLDADFESFVELLQASLDEAYSQCRCARLLSDRPLGAACQALVGPDATAEPPLLRSAFAGARRDWARHCDGGGGDRPAESIEPELTYAVRRLAAYGFAGASSGVTQAMIRDRVGALAEDAASRQPGADRVAAAIVGPPLLDAAFGYSPPRQSLHLVSGLATEAGWSLGGTLRGAAAVQLKGGWSAPLAVTPLLGLAVDWAPCGAALQVQPLVRLGFQLGQTGANDLVASSSCWGGFNGRAGDCVVLQAGVAVTVLELLRLQAVWEESADSRAPVLDHLLLEAGAQFNWPLANP